MKEKKVLLDLKSPKLFNAINKIAGRKT